MCSVQWCVSVAPQEDELLGEPLCTVLSNNHNFHLTGKWYDEKCSEGGYGFICQKPQGSLTFSFFNLNSIFPVCNHSSENHSAGLWGPELQKGWSEKLTKILVDPLIIDVVDLSQAYRHNITHKSNIQLVWMKMSGWVFIKNLAEFGSKHCKHITLANAGFVFLYSFLTGRHWLAPGI